MAHGRSWAGRVTKFYFRLGTDMIVLGSKWAEVLASQPETGMGYQVVTVRTKDGRNFTRVVIVGGVVSSVQGSHDIPFFEEDINEIVVTHDK